MKHPIRVALFVVSGTAFMFIAAAVALRSGHPQPGLSSTAIRTKETPITAKVGDAGASATQGSRNATPRVAADDAPEETLVGKDWDELYRAADGYSFVQSAASAALAGDGRAAWLISLTLRDCKLFVLGAHSADPLVRRSLAELPVPTEETRRCGRFRDSHPLDTLGLPEEARQYAYWRALAVAARDGRAVMARAVSIAGSVDAQAEAETRNKQYRAILDDVKDAVASKDPEAIAYIGAAFMLPDVARDPVQGVLWVLAGCELGFDCRFNAAYGCVSGGTCDDLSFAETLQRDIGPQRFAQLYADAQDIAYKVRAGDWDGLKPYLQTKP